MLLQLTRMKEGCRGTGPGEPLVGTFAYYSDWTCISAGGLELCPRLHGVKEDADGSWAGT